MDKFERLKELKKLFDEGIITRDEFNKEKLKTLEDTDTERPANSSNENDIPTTKKNWRLSKKIIWFALILILVLLAILFKLTSGFKMLQSENTSKSTSPFVNVYFQEDEVFPVHLYYLKNTKQGLMDLTITNPALETKTLLVTYGFAEFGGLDTLSVHVDGGSVKKISITPYSGKFKGMLSPAFVTLLVKVSNEQNKDIYSETWSLKVNPYDEIPWKIKNRDYAKLIASWVTPQNELVEALIRKAKVKIGGNILPVDKMNEEDFRKLVKAIFNTVKDERFTYINNKISFGEGYAQRVRMPFLTIKTKSANSLDGSVLLASLFENAGLRPYIVLLAEHAIVGVARPNQENDKIYIETTLLGRSTIESIFSLESTFSAATKSGKEAYNTAYSNSVNQQGGIFEVIDIHKARQEGVLPLE